MITTRPPADDDAGADVRFRDSTRQWIDAIDGWTDWQRAAGSRPHTLHLRRYQLARLARDHLHRSPWRLTTADLSGWLGGQGWAVETLRGYVSAVRSFYAWGVRSNRVRRDPAARLPRVRQHVGPPRPTPDAVFAAALEAASDRDRLILMLAAYAGLRRTEIAILRWADLAGAELRVQGKGGRVRLVPLVGALVRELAAEAERRGLGGHGTGYRYMSRGDGGWIFPGQGAGAHMTPGRVGKLAGELLGPGWSIHTLRHRFGTRAYAGTRDLLAVQLLMGHSSPVTTRRYTQTPDGALQAAVEAAA
jgi:integrase